MMSISAMRCLALLLLLLTAPAALPAAVFTVTNSNDSGPGSLRQAILDANLTPTRDDIRAEFLPPIVLLSPLPTITAVTVLVGPTLDGSNLGAAPALTISAPGGSVVEATFISFAGDALHIDGASNVSITLNTFGARRLGDGTLVQLPIGGAAIVIRNSQRVEIVENSFISAGTGIDDDGTATLIGENWFGSGGTITGDAIRSSGEGTLITQSPCMFDACGRPPNFIMHSQTGIRLSGTSQTVDSVELDDNRGDAVVVEGGSASLSVTASRNGGNAIRVTGGTATIEGVWATGNGGLIIDNGGDGADLNDALDADVGPNRHQNHPVITRVWREGDSAVVEGYVETEPLKAVLIRLYSSGVCSAQPTEVATLQDARQTVTTDASGRGTFRLSLTGDAAASLQSVSATATLEGATSELSPCATVLTAAEIPALGEWALLLLTLSLAGAAAARIR